MTVGAATKTDRPEDRYLIGVSTSIGLVVTPTLNADGTLALQMGPLRTLGVSVFKQNKNLNEDETLLQDLDNIPTQPIVVRDAQTVALRGLTWNVGPGFPNDPQNPSANVLVLITAHLVRRAEEDTPLAQIIAANSSRAQR